MRSELKRGRFTVQSEPVPEQWNLYRRWARRVFMRLHSDRLLRFLLRGLNATTRARRLAHAVDLERQLRREVHGNGADLLVAGRRHSSKRFHKLWLRWRLKGFMDVHLALLQLVLVRHTATAHDAIGCKKDERTNARLTV